ncbi:MAG: endo-1,4-beta-xylanase [Oscillatoria sp. SIO1A7]|nr:endo-1,4-beta-xylanase [Oscillatoria sp. SIO1A7]
MALKDLAGDDFYIGGAATNWQLDSDEQVRQTLVEEFNLLAPQNEFKIKSVMRGRDDFNYDRADKIVDFARNNSLALRGGNLMWRLEIPHWVAALSTESTRSVLEDYITETVKRYEDSVEVWDVASEMINASGGLVKTHWSQNLGSDFLLDAFRFARQANPYARLFYSDYGWHNESKQRAFLQLVEELDSAGVGIDGVAIQMHHNLQGTLRLLWLEPFLKQLKGLGLEVHFSEVTLWADHRLPWELVKEVQAQAYRRLLSLALKCDVKCFCTWGVSDKYVWRNKENRPFLFDAKFQKKPAYFAVEDVLRE